FLDARPVRQDEGGADALGQRVQQPEEVLGAAAVERVVEGDLPGAASAGLDAVPGQARAGGGGAEDAVDGADVLGQPLTGGLPVAAAALVQRALMIRQRFLPRGL